MNKLLLFFFTLNTIYSCTSSHGNMQKNNDVVFELTFQDFFSKDKVELKVNNCYLFSDTLTSNKIIGYTHVKIIGYQVKEDRYLITYKGISKECSSEKGILNLEIIINGHSNKIKVTISNGKYIGFSKVNQNEVSLNQSIKPFEYD